MLKKLLLVAGLGVGSIIFGAPAPLIAPAWAVEPSEMLVDPVQEARARELSAGLRCLVCQNESIDESHADLARDLRVLIREQISKGQSNEQIKSFLVGRYGDFILLQPPFKSSTVVLWLSPLVILLLGAFAVFRASKGPRQAPAPLSEDEERKLAAIVGAQRAAER